MKGVQEPGDQERNGRSAGRVVPFNTNLMELVSAVSEEVEEKFPGHENLVTRVVFHLLGGEGNPMPGTSVRLPRS
ncbi:MAG: hypothetical protein JXR72_04080 [Proteobacteria bacterium]|nr:hypothetical protein [Pseudomonadota bacterium]